MAIDQKINRLDNIQTVLFPFVESSGTIYSDNAQNRFILFHEVLFGLSQNLCILRLKTEKDIRSSSIVHEEM